MISFMLPTGPINLAPLFPGVDFSQVDEYYIQLRDPVYGEVVVTAPSYRRACCCNEDTFRLYFVNALGGIDSINLTLMTESLEVESTAWKKPLKYPLEKWDGGAQRFNVNSNETRVGFSNCFTEADQEFLKELRRAPNAWVQWKGTQQQANDYIPVLITDGQFVTRKFIERYDYGLQVEFVMSNDDINLRN